MSAHWVDAEINRTIYREWMRSPAWRRLSRRLRQERGSCEVCGSTEDLVCHHRSYDFIMTPHEHRTIQVLCRAHHKHAHGIQ